MQPVFVTQLVDRNHPVLGFAVGLINALATRSDSMVVIANEVRSHRGLADNVRVLTLGKEGGAGRIERGLRLQRAMWAALGGPGRHAILVHMAPVYLNLAVPMARLRRAPLLLWFAHPSETRVLRVAERLCDVVLTSLPGAYPHASPKVRAIGQAVDTDALRVVSPAPASSELRVVAVGRTSPSKGFDVVLRAIARVRERGVPVAGRIVGPSSTALEAHHRGELRRLAAQLDLVDVVRIEEGVPPSEVPGVIAGGDVLANAMVSGSGDKVVFEAAALGRLPFASNTAFAELLGGLPLELRFHEGDDAELADRLLTCAGADERLRLDSIAELRRRVEEGHSLDHWADAVMDAMERAASGVRVG